MSIRYLAYAPVVFVAMFCAGCSDGPTMDVDPPPRQVEEPGAIAANAVDLQPVGYEGLLQFVRKHEGQPVVLDVWSTSCEPCVKELPNLARFHEEYRDRGVVCATLNIDYTGAAETSPEDAKERARPVLEALGVSTHHLYSTIPDTELFSRELFKDNGLYAPPAIFVFDRSGKVVETFGGAEGDVSPYDNVRSTVDALLESPAPAG